jgi:hypothetical protein
MLQAAVIASRSTGKHISPMRARAGTLGANSVDSVNKSREQTRKRLAEFNARGESLVPITRPTEFPYQPWDEYEAHFQRNGPRDVDE